MLSTPLLVIPTLLTILARGRYRTPLILPYLFGILAAWLGLVLSWQHRSLIIEFLPSINLDWIPGFMIGAVHWVLGWWATVISAAAAIIFSAIVSLLAFSAMGALFVEIFLERALRDHQLIRDEPSTSLTGLVSTSIKALIDDLKKLIVFGIIGIALVLSGFFPPLTVAVFLIGGLVLGMQIADEPLKLMKLSFKQRWAILKSHKLDLLALGVTAGVFFIFPFGAVIFMPVFQFTAIKLIKKWGISA